MKSHGSAESAFPCSSVGRALIEEAKSATAFPFFVAETISPSLEARPIFSVSFPLMLTSDLLLELDTLVPENEGATESTLNVRVFASSPDVVFPFASTALITIEFSPSTQLTSAV